ncbi:MAG: GxxExxY protein [Fimbriimonas sp.]|nr:GxxExxY protein [Fimbriimonas sp.]
MTENEIATGIVGAALKVHRALGPGLLKQVYESALAHELTQPGLSVVRQKVIHPIYENVPLGDGCRSDLIVEDKVIVEIRSLESVPAVAYKVLRTYLKLTDLRLGRLINFGDEHVKGGIKRIANGLDWSRGPRNGQCSPLTGVGPRTRVFDQETSSMSINAKILAPTH